MLSNEEDDGDGEYHQSKISGIIEASLVDDWGVNGRILDYIVGLYRHRNYSRSNGRTVGHQPDMVPVKMAS